MTPSQENCLFDNHRYVPTSDRKGIEVYYLEVFVYLSTRNLTCHSRVARFLLPFGRGVLGALYYDLIMPDLLESDTSRTVYRYDDGLAVPSMVSS